GMAVGPDNSIYLADMDEHAQGRIRRVLPGPLLRLNLRAARRQRIVARRLVTLTSRCNRACNLTVTAVVTFAGSKRTGKLRAARLSLNKAGTRRITLRLSAAVRA